MNKNGLCKEVADITQLPEETVIKVLDAVEKVICRLMNNGDELHWVGFLRMWTVIKKPVYSNGKAIYRDTAEVKVRFRMPQCIFAGKVIQPMKKSYFNIARKNRDGSYPPYEPPEKINKKQEDFERGNQL